MKYNISKEKLIQKYIVENYTIDQCAEYFGCSRHPIEDRISKYGIHKTRSHQTIMKMTNEMYDVLRGALLGDGSLLVSDTGNAHFSYSSRSYQHVKFVADYFDGYKTGKGIYTYDKYDKRTNKIYHSNRSSTLTDERNRWYVDGIKHIPKDLVLTPLMCLVWYIGDGGLSTCQGYNAQFITLATNCFIKEELENIILPQLSQFEAKLSKNGIGKNGDTHYQIKIYKKENIIAFLKYIGDCPFEDYRYKWDVKPSKLKNYEQYADEWIQLYNLNFASTKIGLLYNCTHGSVRNVLKKNGVSMSDARNKGLLPPCEEWEILYSNGKTFDEIARIFDCSVEIIKRYFDYTLVNGNEEFIYAYYKNKVA